MRGFWHPQQSSAQSEAALTLAESGFKLEVDTRVSLQGNNSELEFSQRIGNIPRRIDLPDGSVFVTTENDEVDRWISNSRHGARRSQWLHRLESQWRWIVLAILVVIGSMAGFVWKGLPWVSAEIARELPADVYQKIGTGTLESLDQWLFSETHLSSSEQLEIETRFKRLIQAMDYPDYQFKLHFRAMKKIPNAFALPSGDIVISDALIDLSAFDAELDSVLLHEIGHVVERHSLQQIIHSSTLSVLLTLLLGDATAVSSIAVALPVFILESRYSREHESAADEFALQQMSRTGLDPVHFANMMRKLMQSETIAEDATDTAQSVDDINDYLSTHPATEKRIQRALEYSRKLGGS